MITSNNDGAFIKTTLIKLVPNYKFLHLLFDPQLKKILVNNECYIRRLYLLVQIKLQDIWTTKQVVKCMTI